MCIEILCPGFNLKNPGFFTLLSSLDNINDGSPRKKAHLLIKHKNEVDISSVDEEKLL